MKQAEVYFLDKLAGILTEDENGYTFVYSEAYIADNGMPISLTMPLCSYSRQSSTCSCLRFTEHAVGNAFRH